MRICSKAAPIALAYATKAVGDVRALVMQRVCMTVSRPIGIVQLRGLSEAESVLYN